MIDHSEGVLRIRKALATLEEVLRNKGYDAARALCVEIAADARLVAQQISIEEETDATRRTS